MRGETERQATLLLGLTPEGFVARDNPLRRIKPLVDSALRRMSPVFDEVYAAGGRPSIPPEHLHKSSLLMACYTIRSERQFCEQLRYNILFKWFLDLNVEDEPFHPTTFTENRERLMQADPCSSQGQAAARVLLKEVVREARRRETHVSTTGPEARLYGKGKQQGAQLCYLGHVLTENRHGLVVDVELTEADGRAEREAALEMLERSVCGPATEGADRADDTRDFVWTARGWCVTPHMAQHDPGRRSAIDGRTTRHAARASADASGSRRSSAGSRRLAEAATCAFSVGRGTSSGSS